jgi:Endonuclease/Exonuclease/phosphatase family
MGIFASLTFHARDRPWSAGRNDPAKAVGQRRWRAWVCASLISGLFALPLHAETLRVATYHTELTRDGPGLLLRDIVRGEDAQVAAVLQVIARADADILLLAGIDFDYNLVALGALNNALGRNSYPHVFALPPNSGLATGLDLDENGRLGEARDAMGYGRFAGAEGMAVLSRVPIGTITDLSGLLWRDLPGHIAPPMPPEVAAIQRLSTTGHWVVPVPVPGGVLTLLAWSATPPVFDGPEDRNGRRNHDETAVWLRLLDGALDVPAPSGPFIALGVGNLDPVDGDGRNAALHDLLARTQNMAPSGAAGTDTADFSTNDGPGMLRVDYVLPSPDLRVTASGVMWPARDDPFTAVVNAASRHRLVWIDITVP